MKRLDSTETEKIQLEIIECNCGFHIGLDVTYLLQVCDIKIQCPACGTNIDTRKVCPEGIGIPAEDRCGRGQEWVCSRCGYRNITDNEVCMGAEMGDGRCGEPKPDKVKPTCKDCRLFNPNSKSNCDETGYGTKAENNPCDRFKPKPKPLAQYLFEHDCEYADVRSSREYFQQALDAYESTENVKIRIERI